MSTLSFSCPTPACPGNRLKNERMTLHPTAQQDCLELLCLPQRTATGGWQATPLMMWGLRERLGCRQESSPVVVWIILQYGKGNLRPRSFIYMPLNQSFYILNIYFSGLCAFGYFEACYTQIFSLPFFFFFKNNKRMKALRYSKEEDSLTGIISNSFSGGGLLLGQGGVGSKGL